MYDTSYMAGVAVVRIKSAGALGIDVRMYSAKRLGHAADAQLMVRRSLPLAPGILSGINGSSVYNYKYLIKNYLINVPVGDGGNPSPSVEVSLPKVPKENEATVGAADVNKRQRAHSVGFNSTRPRTYWLQTGGQSVIEDIAYSRNGFRGNGA